MLEMHLKHPEFTHSACGSFTKNKKRIQKFKETRDSRYIYQNELDNDCFQQVTYGDFKDLTKRTASDKILRDKAFDISKNPKYTEYQCGLASMVYEFSIKKTFRRTVKNENISNKQLAEELHTKIIRKFNKRKIHSPFIENIWGADLPDIQLVSKFVFYCVFLSFFIDIFSKYAWVIPLKDKKKVS